MKTATEGKGAVMTVHEAARSSGLTKDQLECALHVKPGGFATSARDRAALAALRAAGVPFSVPAFCEAYRHSE